MHILGETVGLLSRFCYYQVLLFLIMSPDASI